MGRNLVYFTGGNKWELEYSLRYPKAENGNGNEAMGIGGSRYTEVIPHISTTPATINTSDKWHSEHQLL